MSTQAESPNILLAIADDLGQDVLSIIGSGSTRAMKVHTQYSTKKAGTVNIFGYLPTISLLLRNGLYFSQAWAQPACSTTRASIFTGLHPWKNGVGKPPGALDSRADLFSMLPTLLPDGYVSGLFGKWHLGEDDGYRPTDHGWNKHVGTLDGIFDPDDDYDDKTKVDYWHWFIQDSDINDYEPEPTTTYATYQEVKAAADWINEQDPATPWFATIAFHSPHSPFHIPDGGYNSGTVGDHGKPAYMFNVMTQNMDHNLGRLLGTSSGSSPLPLSSIPEDQLENTIIVFIGDNGSASQVALAEAKEHIYEGSLRVPMIIADGQAAMKEFKGETNTPRFLNTSRLNATCPEMAHVVDLYKTIVHLVDSAASEFPEDTDSEDFSDVVKNAPPSSPIIPIVDVKRSPGVVDVSDFLEGSLFADKKRDYNFSQFYWTDDTDGTLHAGATIRNSSYKLNYDTEDDPVWALYKYSFGEITGEEDAGAVDLYADAISGKNAEAETNLDLLYAELIANYQPDDDGNTFPSLE